MKIAVVTGASAGIGREFVYAIDRQEQLDEIWVIARRAERLEELKEYMENNFQMKNEYVERVENFFIYTDKNNCKRVYDKIKEIPLKD